MTKLICAFATLLTVAALTMPVSADVSGCQEMISQARSAYYNLGQHGFTGFKAMIEPNWEVTLGPASTQESVKLFSSLHFSMSSDANGAVTVTHDIAAADKARVEAYVTEIHNNVQRLVVGFFGVWNRFMVNSPFPANDAALKFNKAGKECRLLFTTESTDVSLALTKDLVITEWSLSGPRTKRTIKPRFQKTAGGLLLNGYSSLFVPVGEGIRTELEITIQHQDVEGLKLPHKVKLRGTHGGEPVAAELTFSQYVLKPRQARQ
jgi:hypothetical protein